MKPIAPAVRRSSSGGIGTNTSSSWASRISGVSRASGGEETSLRAQHAQQLGEDAVLVLGRRYVVHHREAGRGAEPIGLERQRRRVAVNDVDVAAGKAIRRDLARSSSISTAVTRGTRWRRMSVVEPRPGGRSRAHRRRASPRARSRGSDRPRDARPTPDWRGTPGEFGSYRRVLHRAALGKRQRMTVGT